jgi:hypothetical protein
MTPVMPSGMTSLPKETSLLATFEQMLTADGYRVSVASWYIMLL